MYLTDENKKNIIFGRVKVVLLLLFFYVASFKY